MSDTKNENTEENKPAVPAPDAATADSVEPVNSESESVADKDNDADKANIENTEEPKKKSPPEHKKRGESYDQSMNNMLDSLKKFSNELDEFKKIVYDLAKETKLGKAIAEKYDKIGDAVKERFEDLKDKAAESWSESDMKKSLDETQNAIGNKVDDFKDYVATTAVGSGLKSVGDKVGAAWDSFSKYKVEDWIRPDKPEQKNSSTQDAPKQQTSPSMSPLHEAPTPKSAQKNIVETALSTGVAGTADKQAPKPESPIDKDYDKGVKHTNG